MKKKILLSVFFVFATQTSFMSASLDEQVLEIQQDQEIILFEEDECADFFYISDDDIESMEHQPKKEKWSYARVLAVRMGVAMVLTARNCCSVMHRVWNYMRSWVPV